MSSLSVKHYLINSRIFSYTKPEIDILHVLVGSSDGGQAPSTDQKSADQENKEGAS